MVARFSRGERRQWPKSGPPTYSTKPPNSSLKAVRTSSSSSTDSVRESVIANASACGCMRTVQERNQLIASALRTQCEGDGGESTNGVQAKKDVVMLGFWSAARRTAYSLKCGSHLELVDEDSNRVQLVALVLALHDVSVSIVAVRRVKEWMAVVQDSRRMSCSHSLRGRNVTLRGVVSGIERWSGNVRSV